MDANELRKGAEWCAMQAAHTRSLKLRKELEALRAALLEAAISEERFSARPMSDLSHSSASPAGNRISGIDPRS